MATAEVIKSPKFKKSKDFWWVNIQRKGSESIISGSYRLVIKIASSLNI